MTTAARDFESSTHSLLADDWSAVRLIASRGVRSVALSVGPYVLLSGALAVTLLQLRSALRVISVGYLSVLFEPFVAPLIAVDIAIALFLALNTSMGIAREREMGALETLFQGPISHYDFLLGKLLASGIVYMVLAGLYLLSCVTLGALVNVTPSLSLLIIAAVGLPTTLAVVCASLVCVSGVRTARGTLLLFLGMTLTFASVAIGRPVLVSLVTNSGSVGLIVLRDTISKLAVMIGWLSPVAYLLNATDAALRGNLPLVALHVSIGFLYAFVGLKLAASLLRRNGVLS